MQFLSQRGLAFRGNHNEKKFEQLMNLSPKVDSKIVFWVEKTPEKYVPSSRYAI